MGRGESLYYPKKTRIFHWRRKGYGASISRSCPSPHHSVLREGNHLLCIWGSSVWDDRLSDVWGYSFTWGSPLRTGALAHSIFFFWWWFGMNRWSLFLQLLVWVVHSPFYLPPTFQHQIILQPFWWPCSNSSSIIIAITYPVLLAPQTDSQ